jgi:hypothetical protein
VVNSSSCPAAAAWLRRATRRTTSRQCTCRFLGWDVNAVKEVSATCACEIHRCSASSQTARGYLIVAHECSGIAVIAYLTAGSIRTVTEKKDLAAKAAAMTSRR